MDSDFPHFSPVVTDDGSLTLRHPEHGECYHSTHGARAEARWLYVEASGILQSFATPGAATRVLDVGLGLGYNALATLDAWRAAPSPGPLEVLSLEIDAALVAALASGSAPWQANWSDTERALTAAGLAGEPLIHPNGQVAARWRVIVGDALAADLSAATDSSAAPPPPFDFVWQDAFSPTKNPPLWTAAWFAHVRAASRSGTVLMSYSVARSVRDALAAAGWDPARIPTPVPRKRHWLKAVASASC